MDEKTLTALQGSIKKWEAIVSGRGIDLGSNNCPLCDMFIQNCADEPEWAQNGCLGCPVSDAVDAGGCGNTPYGDFSYYCRNLDQYKVFDETSKGLAQAELDFLKSLLPTGDAAPQTIKGESDG